MTESEDCTHHFGSYTRYINSGLTCHIIQYVVLLLNNENKPEKIILIKKRKKKFKISTKKILKNILNAPIPKKK